MKYSRLLVLLVPILVLIFLESVVFRHSLFFVSLLLANLAILAAVLVFVKAGKTEKFFGSYLGAAILPLGFLSSIFVYSSLVVNKFLIQFLFFSAFGFIYFYLRYIYYYLVRPEFCRTDTIKSISAAGNFFMVFFSASAVYGFQSFLNIPVWLLMACLLVVIFLAVYQIMWANKIKIKTAIAFILISGVILFEVGWAMSFLPLRHDITGLILAIYYYILIGLSLAYLAGSLSGKVVKNHLIFGFLGTLLVLLTARWM
ncbi:MAG: hypothetical protein PHQ42_02440 [Patescibacteria group bacterium]|nr:hypothetical protein [Patescibacteria group bacterium]